MGYEILREDAITPQRMYTLLCAANEAGLMPKTELIALIQPHSIINNSDAFDRINMAIRRCGLAIEEGSQKTLRLLIPPPDLASFATFRRYLQGTLLGVTEASADNFVLNQFAAWYACQDSSVIDYSNVDLEKKFNDQMYPSAEMRAFRETRDFNGWRTWAEFLGWGWTFQIGARRGQQLAPDATMRLEPFLDELLVDAAEELPFGVFIRQLPPLCPELDGGILFEQCWQASRGNEVRGNQLSLMLSTALRTLHKQGQLELLERADAAESWTLFPSQSYINRVTHIRRKMAA